MPTGEGKQARVLAALRDGAETAMDVAAVLDMSEKHASCHLSNLARLGRVRVVGLLKYPGPGHPAKRYEAVA